jgi:ribosomal protein S27E
MAATLNPKAFPFSSEITCPGCQHSITLYDQIGCEAVVCPQCRSYLLFNDAGRPYVEQKIHVLKFKPVMPLGTTGTLKGVEYKLIAYLEKKEGATRYEWREYMLYNYAKGYAFLSEYDGHWSLIAGANFYPDLASVNCIYGNEAEYEGNTYLKYNAYSPVITAMIGEFDWDISAEKLRAKEFIDPPYMLTSEENIKKYVTDWYLGEYLEEAEIAAAFNIPVESFPEKIGIGANQPSKYKARWLAAYKISGIAALAFLLVQLSVIWLRPEKVLLSDTYALAMPPHVPDTSKHVSTALDSLRNRTAPAPADSLNSFAPDANGNYEFKSFKTPTFIIPDGPVPLEFELNSQVDNNWLSATVELVSEKDNQTWSISKDIEYYHGYEDGESWSEGSYTQTVLLSEIPAGKYHINIYPYAGTRDVSSLFIKVTESVTLWRNVLVTLLLLCLYPLYCWYRMRKFETNRWMNSDFSPYQKDDE